MIPIDRCPDIDLGHLRRKNPIAFGAIYPKAVESVFIGEAESVAIVDYGLGVDKNLVAIRGFYCPDEFAH